MYPRHVVTFLALLAWQTAPSGPRDRPSRLRVWLGAGRGTFDFTYSGATSECVEFVGCSCTREILHPWRVDDTNETGSAGMQVDGWASPTIRISTAYGSASSRWAEPDAGSGRSRFAAGLVAWEGAGVGLGAGWTVAAERLGFQGPAGYLRLGRADGAHFRADVRAPTATPGATGWAHAGLAYNQGRRGGSPEFFLGVSAVEGGYAYGLWKRLTRPALFADVVIPMNENAGVFARGHAAEKARGFSLGLALRL